MKPGAVLVDISIDQGGCFEDSRPTTHADPTYPVHDSVFYCVANMPGAVPHTSTYALTNVTLPYAVELANRGWREALRRPTTRSALGLNTHDGQVTYGPVAEAHGMASITARRGARPDRAGRRPAARAGRPAGDARWTGRSTRLPRPPARSSAGVAANTLASYRRDLRRYLAFLRRLGV